jgi:eukaryotic-like serine/threonine-protein kinase
MELITNNEAYGVELEKWFDKSYQFTIEEILRYSMQFCDGMIHAKEKFSTLGKIFVHRDIKPSNILITEDKIIKITDFGMVGGTE